MNKWTLFQEQMPPKGTKFVAIFNDGSGSDLFVRLDSGEYINCCGDEASDEMLDDYLFWHEAPNMKLWFELIQESEN